MTTTSRTNLNLVKPGRFYINGHGETVGPIFIDNVHNEYWPFKAASHPGKFYKATGFSCHRQASNHNPLDDLIREKEDRDFVLSAEEQILLLKHENVMLKEQLESLRTDAAFLSVLKGEA